MRRLIVLAATVVALAACEGPGGTVASPTSSPSPAPTSTSPSETPPYSSATSAPSPSPRPIPPAWATPIDDDLDPDGLDDASLVPPDAALTSRVTLPAAGGLPDQVAVAYVLGSDPFAAEHGFAIWQRFEEPPAWSVVFAFVDDPSEGVLAIDLQAGDVTSDGHDDAFTFEQTGGSGACGRWRVVAASAAGTDQVFQRRACDTEIVIAAGALEVREAVYEPDDAHCCPSAFRYTTIEWDGSSFVETDVREEPTG